MTSGRIGGLLLFSCVLAGTLGCRTYEITQNDFYAAPSFNPQPYRRAAIITHQTPVLQSKSDDRELVVKSDRNNLFLEAFHVELMKRGFEVVEREKFASLVQEQLLVRGEMANLSDREKAIRVGKMLKVDVVFYVDALANSTRYVYDPPMFGKAKAAEAERKANTSGVVEGVGSYVIHAYHDVGVTARAIDARTGEIVWVGYRMLSVCEEVTEKSPTALTSFSAVKKLGGMLLDDFLAKNPRKAPKA